MFLQAITYILSGSLLATSFQSPSICHVHAGGNLAHSHDVDRHHEHVDGHHHGHSHHHPHVEQESHEQPLTLEPPHVHFSIVGFEFSLTLPVDGRSNGPFAAENDLDFVGVFKLVDEVTTMSRAALPDPFAFTLDESIASNVNGLADRWRCVRDLDRTRLCDNARCERSGVLLI